MLFMSNTWKWRTMDSRQGQAVGSCISAPSPNDTPKLTVISLSDVIEGFRASIDKCENPHPSEISSNLKVFPNAISSCPG